MPAPISSVLIIGGSGFLGCHLVDLFYKLTPRPEIHILDIRPPPALSPNFYSFNPDDISFHKGDITDPDSLRAIFRVTKPDVIIHSASPVHGMGKEIYFKVNVDGTQTIVDVALEQEFWSTIKAVVYTSSASVIYDGSDLKNADETFEFPEVAMDAYNETKVLGEQIVLSANGKGAGLKTCALRPSGLFGPGDRQLVPGMLAVLKTNGTLFQLGDNMNLFDFTYIGNVAHAHVLAAQKLLDGDVSDVAGEAFFITNDAPVYFFTMPRTIWAHKGYVPKFIISMPRGVGMTLAYLSESFSKMRGKEALFTRFRVAFTCANRYFNINKAVKRLGYTPTVGLEEGVIKTLQWLDEEEAARNEAAKKEN
ncbi:3-beta hydroxysteroid dehydrogenase/isomerase family-domain-containing protein [Lipomyces doorenjongii]|uniref:3-beta hydroxysteroid dehydrogenase/isomerase family-domain-containing protein n=1 Tax=Lipomyces doorenjongii TaxID=383834 RepID=UPI0034CF22F0